MKASDSIKEMELICQNRWPRIICHCPDSDPIQRIRFCLHLAGLCTPAEMKADITPELISLFSERVKSSVMSITRDSESLLSSLSLFRDITSPDTVRNCLTGHLLKFPLDVISSNANIGETSPSPITIESIHTLEKDLEQLRSNHRDLSEVIRNEHIPPDCTDLIESLPHLLNTIKLFRDEFASSLASLLQSNAPLLQLQSSPIGEELGRTSSDLVKHLHTFRQLLESIHHIRDGLNKIREKSRLDSSNQLFHPDSITQLQRQIHTLQRATALGQHDSHS